MATRYAILIGINAYPQNPLRGCVRDVVELEKRLLAMSEQVHIRKFTADAGTATDSTNPVQASQTYPSYHCIVSELRQVTACANRGDLIYIHYSGHGTTIERDNGVSGPTTHDLALVLLESSVSSQVKLLGGVELASLLKAMVDKGLTVTLVLDCCFSGGVVRKDNMVRYMECDPVVDTTCSLGPHVDTIADQTVQLPINRGASMRANWLMNPEGYTILTACGPHQVAKELILNKNGDRQGALSYFLLRVFSKLGGVGGKQHQVYQHLHARFQELRAKGVNKQTPMLFGNKGRYFFGLTATQPDSHPVSCMKRQDGSIQLEAGRAHGICELDEFALYPLDSVATSTSTQRSFLVATVTEVGELSSNVSLADNTSGCVETGWMAEAVTMRALQQWPIQLQQSIPSLATWVAALQTSRSLVVRNYNEKSENACFFLLLVNGDKNIEVQDDRNRALFVINPDSTDSQENLQHLVLETLTHLIRFKLVRSLANPPSECMGRSFATSFQIWFINARGDAFVPGCSRVKQVHADCSHAECAVEVDEGEQFHLVVENRNDSEDRPLYIHLYSMGHDWEIENVLHGNHDVIPPKNTSKRITGRWQKKIKMTVSEETRERDFSHCEDIVKIFITSRPTSFASLELPELMTSLVHKKVQMTRTANLVGPLDDWAALNFRIRTRLSLAVVGDQSTG